MTIKTSKFTAVKRNISIAFMGAGSLKPKFTTVKCCTKFLKLVKSCKKTIDLQFLILLGLCCYDTFPILVALTP
jgi:hypothetical protein